MYNDVIINKTQSIHRCILRVREEYRDGLNNFNTDFSRQDAAILNIIRACETAIDLANYIIKNYKFGIPKNSSNSFELLFDNKIISESLYKKMKSMVGFRNIVVHEYQRIEIDIVTAVIKDGLNDILKYTDKIVEFLES